MVSSADEKEYDVSRSKKHSHSRKRSRHSIDRNQGDDEEDKEYHHRHVKGSTKKHHKRDKKSKHRKSRYDEDAHDDEQSSASSSSNERRRDRKKRHDRTKKDKKHSKKDRRTKHDNHDSAQSMDPLERNHLLANELCSLFDHHPDFATELPIILIRLGRGATFDLSGMTNQDAAQRLIQVLQCFIPFGVSMDDDNVWSWSNPAASRNSTTNNELVLIRVVRALLDQIGLTLDAIDDYENPTIVNHEQSSEHQVAQSYALDTAERVDSDVEQMTKQMLETFRESKLAEELAGICDMILEGEMINLDGVPDDTVRESLESLLNLCGLEKSEMEVDDEDDVDTSNHKPPMGPPMGYGLPESEMERAKQMLSNVIHVCRSKPKANTRRPVKGPMLPGAYDDQPNSSDDDDEGPLPAGAVAILRDNKLSKEQIKALAARRSYELNCAKEGIAIDPEAMNGVREEWMVVPGKYDFLGSIQTGRSRTFAGKSKLNNQIANDEVIDPKIQAEIRAIREAYEETRGPSLMDQHREMKRKEQQQQQSTSASWKWDRDKDLDAGRRVDKDALGMILGGAGSDLKNKFQSGI